MFSFLLSDEEFQSSEEGGGQFIANRGLVCAKAVIESVIALRGFSTAFYHHARARGRGNPKGFFCTMEFATTRKIDNTI